LAQQVILVVGEPPQEMFLDNHQVLVVVLAEIHVGNTGDNGKPGEVPTRELEVAEVWLNTK
jgi:hypothetical protein